MEIKTRRAASLAAGLTRLRTPAAALAVATAFACLGLVYWLESFPRYVDFDSATLGIFVNDLSYHGRFDYSFVSPNRAAPALSCSS